MTMKLRTVLLLGFLFSSILLNGKIADKNMESPSNETLQRFDSIPLHFEENRGQLDEQVSFLGRGLGYQLMLTPKERVMLILQPESKKTALNLGTPSAPEMPEKPRAYAIRMLFEGANENVTMESEGELGTKVNYLRGRDRDKWIRNAATFEKVRYKNLYDGIDVVYYGNQRQVQYDFIVQPGASFENIRMKFDGVLSLQVNSAGDLVLELPDGDLIQRRPYLYQNVEGVPMQVEGEFHLVDEETVQFLVKDYDEELPLVIDPVIEYSKIFGGSGSEVAYGIQVDNTGNVYLTGVTSSFDFPTTPAVGALPDVNYNGGTSDIFVSKVAPDGLSFVWSTYIGGEGDTNGSGGSGQDVAYDLALDATGSVYVAGTTASEDFPADARYYTVASYPVGSFAPGRHNPFPINSMELQVDDVLGFGNGSNTEDAIVFKLTPDGSDLAYSILLGTGSPDGLMYDHAFGVDVDNAGRAYVVGATFPIEPPADSTFTTLFPTTANAFSQQPHFAGSGSWDGFVTVLEADPIPLNGSDVSGIIYSTYVSGGGDDYVYEVALDDSNLADVSIWITGTSDSLDINFENSSPLPVVAAPILFSKLEELTNAPFVEDVYLSLATNPFDSDHNGEFDAFVLEMRPALAPVISDAPVEPNVKFPVYSDEDVTYEVSLTNYTADLVAYTGALNTYELELSDFLLNSFLGYPAHWEFATPPENRPFTYLDANAPTAEESDAAAAFADAQAAWTSAQAVHKIVFEEGQTERLDSVTYGTWLGGGPRGRSDGGDGEGSVGDDGLAPNPGGNEFAADDIGFDIALDSNGFIYVGGSTSSSDFPTSNLAFQTKYGGDVDGWLFKLDPTQANSNNQMLFSTYLAGEGADTVQSIVVNGSDEPILTGYTASADFPASSNAFDIVANGGRDVFVTHVNADGSNLKFSTFLGGFSNDEGNKIALNTTFDPQRVFVTGYTNSLDFLTTVDPLADPADTFYIRGVDSIGNAIDVVPEFSAGFITQYDMSQPTPVDNDNFENRRFLGGFGSTIVGNTEAATFETDEPDHGGETGGKSVWFSWTSVAVGEVVLTTEGSDFDTLLSVYSGPSFANFQVIAENDDKSGSVTWSEVRFPVSNGDIFAIAIDGKGGAFGNYKFNLKFETFNDLFTSTFNTTEFLTSLEHHEDSSNVTAGREGSEPNHGTASVGKSIWWTWVAPTTGLVNITADATTVLDGETWKPVIAVYSGNDINDLEPTLVADNVTGVATDPQTGQPVVLYTNNAAVSFIAQRNIQYRIALDGPVGATPSTGNITLNILQEYNDRFADAEDLNESSNDLYTIYARGENFNATQEPLEPQHAGNAGGKSVWWKWTAPANGLVNVATFWDGSGPIPFSESAGELPGETFDTLLAVYVGDTLTDLQEVASDNNSGPNGTSQLDFLAISGTTYWIAVDGLFDGTTTDEGNIRLQINLLPQNNLFADASVISGSSLSVGGFNLNASKEVGEPAHAGEPGGKSIWWRWTSPTNGQVIVDTSGSNFDTVLGIYTGGALGSLVEVTSNDNYTSPDLASQVVFDGVAGVEYFFAVDGKTIAGLVAEGQVTLSLTTRTDNNNFLQSFVLTGFVDSDESNNAAADKQVGEPDHAGGAGGKSLWWSWVAASTGPVEINTVGSSVDTLLAVYTGDSIAQLSLVGSNDNDGGTSSRVTFNAVAGVRYRIAVDGKAGASGLLRIQLTMPANNDLAKALVIDGNSLQFIGTTFNANMEAGEQPHDSGNSSLIGGSVWYQWTAGKDGLLRISASSASVDLGVAAYVGDDFLDFESGQLAVGVNKEIAFPVGAGQSYFIAVRGAPTQFQFNLELIEESIVGTFGGAIPVSGFITDAVQNNNNAFKEAGEPLHAGNSGGRSVWFNWVAPEDGLLTVSTGGSDFDTLLAVYIGTSLTDLLAVASNDNFSPDVTSQVTLPVVAGESYYIAVDGRYDLLANTIASGNIQLSLSLAPFNNDFGNAALVTGGELLIQSFTTNATKQGGEPNHAGDVGGSSVWFDYLAPADGMVVIDTTGSEFDTLLAVYNGEALGSLSLITQNDNLGSVLTASRVVILAEAGESYKIAVDGKNGESGYFNLSFIMISENDSFADRINLSGTFLSTSGVTNTATHELGEPLHGGNVGARSIWWEWTAPSDGRLDLDVTDSDFDTLMGVYLGDAVNDLTTVASNDDFSGTETGSFISLPVVGGSTYKIAVDGKSAGGSNARGTVFLTLEFNPAPANDNFALALDLVGPNANDAANNAAASVEPGESFDEFETSGRSVWWKWTAPALGQLKVDTLGSDFDTVLAVAVGPAVNDLTVIGFNDDADVEVQQSSLSILVGGGTTYYLLVDGAAGGDVAESGNVTINLSFTNATTGGGAFEPADDFEDVEPIVGYGFNITTTNATATQEIGEPLHARNPGGKSIWFEWLAPATGRASIDTAGSNYNSLLGVYTGTELNDLVEIVSNDNVSGANPTSRVQFIAIEGTLYLIAIDGFFDSSSGTTDAGQIVLNLSLFPANDDFETATAIGEGSSDFTAFNFNASKETGEPDHGGNVGGSSIWWKWEAQSDVLVSVDTAGSARINGAPVDTVLAIYSGDAVNALTLVDENDDYSSPDGASQISFLASAGETYYIAVDGVSTGGEADEGTIALNFVLIETNNLFSSSSTIVGYDPGVIFGSNEGADKEANEPEHGGNAGGSSVWWSWVAPQTGPVSLSTKDSVIDTLLAVYTGNSIAGLNLVAENDNASNNVVSSEVFFEAQQGTQYRIAVDGKNGVTGGIQLHLKTPSNDDFAKAIQLSGPEIEIVSHNFETTVELGEPNHIEESAGRSVWWQWTAPKDGRVTVSTAGSDFDSILAIYAGTTLESLALIAGEDNTQGAGKNAVVSFNAASGASYYIVVDGSDDVIVGEETDYVGEINLSLILERERVVGSFSGGDMLTGNAASVTGNNSDAFQEPGEPQHAGNAGGKSLWYTWTAPEDGTLFLDTAGSAINTLLGLYEGSVVSNLTEVASNDDAFPGNQTSSLAVGVQAGITYHIAVDGVFDPVTGITEAGAIKLNLLLGPTNNDFVNAIPITGNKGVFTSFVNNADAEIAEPFHAGIAANHSVWWRMSPDINGVVILDTAGSDFDTVLAVYRGTGMSTLVPVANGSNNNHTSPDLTSQVVFEVLAGNVYYIAVDAVTLANDQGKVFLSYSAVGSSGGDAFADCGTLNGYTDSSSASNALATRESGEPMHAGKSGGKSVWWCWTSPGNGVVRITTEQSTISTTVGAYIGQDVTALLAVSPIEDPQRVDPSSITFRATKDVTYRIAVDGAIVNGKVESGIVFIQLGLSTDNDNFQDRINLGNGSNIAASGTNYNGTVEEGEPVHGGVSGGKSAWWSWTPTVKGTVVIDTLGSGFDTAIGVYRGSGLSALSEIGGNDDATPSVSYSRLTFMALAGRTYHIAVDGVEGDEGDVVLNINHSPIDDVQLVNVSTRGFVGVNQQTMIAGFIVQGDPGQSSRVIIRALGNSLVTGGLSPSVVVPDPDLLLVKDGAIIGSNKQWINGSSPTLVAQLGLAPIDPNEAVLIADLLPGAYTVHVTDALGRSGIGLVEVYYVLDENSGGSNSRLSNISTRAFTGAGDQRLIGGFIVSGSKPKKVLIRGIGSSLGAAGVANALTNTYLELHSGGNLINSNDNWQSAANSGEVAGTLPPGSVDESALLLTLDPGSYTAILSGAGGATGIGLIEVYEVNN